MQQNRPAGSTMDSPAKTAAGPLRRETLHHSAVAELRAMILEGELPPGRRVPEMELCAQLGISRTPLREALRVLAAEGLVELRPHRGAVVTPIDPKEIAAIFEVMEALESLAGRLACGNGSAEAFAELDRLHDALVAQFHAGERAAYSATNRRIHDRIIAMSGNPVLEATYRGFAAQLGRARSLANYDTDRWQESLAEHEAVMDALRRRDAAATAALLADHSRRTADAVLRSLRQDGSSDGISGNR